MATIATTLHQKGVSCENKLVFFIRSRAILKSLFIGTFLLGLAFPPEKSIITEVLNMKFSRAVRSISI